MHVLHNPKAGQRYPAACDAPHGPPSDRRRSSILSDSAVAARRGRNTREWEMVPAAGVEPARASSARRILSPLRMPISPRRLVKGNGNEKVPVFTRYLLAFCASPLRIRAVSVYQNRANCQTDGVDLLKTVPMLQCPYRARQWAWSHPCPSPTHAVLIAISDGRHRNPASRSSRSCTHEETCWAWGEANCVAHRHRPT